MRIFVSAGEPSGDLHASNLMRELRARAPNLEFVGFGGPKMAAAGCHLLFELTQLAVMGVWPVVVNLFRFVRLLWIADRYLRDERPDAVVMVDFPGFHWWLARRAKARGIPVFYYGTPQLWAWASWRVRKLRRLVDHALCKLPFEPAWYAERGCRATYVGHPYFDELTSRRFDEAFIATQRARDGRLVLVLPGSRTQEVRHNLRDLLEAARQVQTAVPDVRVAVASYNERQAEAARAAVAEQGIDAEVFVGRTPELMQVASACLACSGSVSLELLYFRRPTVILYRISRWAQFGLKHLGLIRVKFITLVNLLATPDIRKQDNDAFDPDAPGAEDVPFPEYLTGEDKTAAMARHVIHWLSDPKEYERRVEQLEQIAARFAHAGASAAAARYVLQALGVATPTAEVRRACA